MSINPQDRKDPEITKPYIVYENQYEVVSNSEEFKNFIGHKLKRAWINKYDKLCLESFILYSFDKTDKDKYYFYPVVKGISSSDKQVGSLNILFSRESDISSFIFCGYMDEKKIRDEINAKLQNLY